MKESTKKFLTGPAGWGVCITSGKGVVEAAITGPQTGHYNGDWMTPEQAEAIGIGFIHAAEAAREKAVEANRSSINYMKAV